MEKQPANSDVAIFWDYENCPAPASASGWDIVREIRNVAQTYGGVKVFKAYLELPGQISSSESRSLHLRSELQASGVSLTDCPHNGRKDVADKMMLVDMMAHAIDNPSPLTYVVITGDRDFAYAISVLRLRCYKIILITPSSAHSSLTCQPTTCIGWNALLDQVRSRAQESDHQPPATPRRQSLRERVSPPTSPRDRLGTLSEDDIARPHQPDTNGDVDLTSFLKPQSPQSDYSASLRDTSSTPPGGSTRDEVMTTYSDDTLANGNVDGSDVTLEERFHLQGLSSEGTAVTGAQISPNVYTAVMSPTSHLTFGIFSETDSRPTSSASREVHEREAPDNGLSNNNGIPSPIAPKVPLSDQNKPTPPSGSNEAQPMSSAPQPAPSAPQPTPSAPQPPPPPQPTPSVPRPAPSAPQPTPSAPQPPPPPQQPSDSQQTPPAPKVLPPPFRMLILILRKYKEKGFSQLPRTNVGQALGKDVYNAAGVQKFSQYIALAESERIVRLGGKNGDAWIALRPEWF